jgi:hypothetical protein
LRGIRNDPSVLFVVGNSIAIKLDSGLLFGDFNSIRGDFDELLRTHNIFKPDILARDQLQLDAVSNHTVRRVFNDIQPTAQRIFVLFVAIAAAPATTAALQSTVILFVAFTTLQPIMVFFVAFPTLQPTIIFFATVPAI